MNCKTPGGLGILILGATFSGLIGCRESAPDIPDNPTPEPSITVRLKNFMATSEAAQDVEIFQFTDGTLKKKIVSNNSDEEAVNVFTKEENARIYALYGFSIDAVEGSTDEETFAKTIVTISSDSQSAPVFYTAIAEPDNLTDQLEMELLRGVARIDINNSDESLKIQGVEISNVPVSTYIFPGNESTCESLYTSWSRNFPENINGIETGVFTLFESEKPVKITFNAMQHGKPTELIAEVPTVKRNKVYTIRFVPDPTSDMLQVKPVVTISDWEAGDDVPGGPDAKNAPELDLANSVLPSNVKYDDVTGIINVPASGSESLKLAFRSDVRVEIDTIQLTGADVERDALAGRACTISGRKVEEKDNAVITTYDLKILPQLICRAEYNIAIRIRKASMVSSYDYITLHVAEHPQQIETVKIGGREWMCYNATSSNLEDQIFSLEGTTVEEMYNEHYVDCIGMYFQYGKPNPFSPWTSNDPNQFADQTRNIPWKSPESMPLPPGYHVASAADWKALMPNGVVLPDTYLSESGDSIRGSVVTLPGYIETPSANANRQKLLMRYVLFESLTTGAKLYIPIAGVKANTTNEVPGHGGYAFQNRTAYWIQEDRYTWLIDYKATADKKDGAILKQDRWSYDGFLLVRGVKD